MDEITKELVKAVEYARAAWIHHCSAPELLASIHKAKGSPEHQCDLIEQEGKTPFCRECGLKPGGAVGGYYCIYCGTKGQSVPGSCSGCGIALTGPIEDMTVRELQRIVTKNGHFLEVKVIDNKPKYYLAI